MHNVKLPRFSALAFRIQTARMPDFNLMRAGMCCPAKSTNATRSADLPKAKDIGVRWGMLVPMGISWTGVLLSNAFYVWYFLVRAPNAHSAAVCGAATVLVLLAMPGLIRFLKFMERP